uniref:Uncharacterized protein n=1 Tax=Oryza barthii TaxID=65489 RepID=A0A0D3FVF7_9ORYZ
MEVFIHEDYVNKRNEVRREQRRKQLQMEPSTTVGSPTASATAAEAAETVGHRLFDCLKPY